MKRRQAIQHISFLVGGTIVASNALLNWTCSDITKKVIFNREQIFFLEEVTETIIPTTDTPGARDAGVGTLISLLVKDCYTKEQQDIIHQGLKAIDEKSNEMFAKLFLNCSFDGRTEVLTHFDKEQVNHQSELPHFFRMLKSLTLFGYFNSEIGMTQSLRYAPVPGRYEACIDYKKGDKSFVQL